MSVYKQVILNSLSSRQVRASFLAPRHVVNMSSIPSPFCVNSHYFAMLMQGYKCRTINF